MGVKFAMTREGIESMEEPGDLEANSIHSATLNLSPIMIRPLLRPPQPSLIQHAQPFPTSANDQLNSIQHLQPTHDKEQTAGRKKLPKRQNHPQQGDGEKYFQWGRKTITKTHEEDNEQHSKQMQ